MLQVVGSLRGHRWVAGRSLMLREVVVVAKQWATSGQLLMGAHQISHGQRKFQIVGGWGFDAWKVEWVRWGPS